MPPETLRDVVDVFVVDVAWSALQPEQAGPIRENNAIDRALAAVRSQSARSLRFKLRVRAGVDAPGWVKALGGEPVPVTDAQEGLSGTIGRFWAPEFGEAYRDLQAKLSDRYDSEPELLEVVISRCTTVYSEPFVRNINHQPTVRALLAAGFTRQADEQCHRDQIAAHAVWEFTRSGLALNPYQAIASDGIGTIDLGFTISMMRYCREQLGLRCVLENNSIRWPPFQGTMASMYDTIASLGPPISFQTASPDRIGDLGRTLEWALNHGAAAVELPRGYDALLSKEDLTEFDARLEDNE